MSETEKKPMNKDTIPSTQAWLNGRETWLGSGARGEVVVPQINVWERQGSRGRVLGTITHGCRVDVIERVWDPENEQFYYRILDDGVQGWVSEGYIAWEWSCFTFIGKLSPAQACTALDINLAYGGMQLLSKQDGIAITTEGQPADFESIQLAVVRLANRLKNALATITATPLQVELSNWVEVSISGHGNPRVVGFTLSHQQGIDAISSEQIELAHSLLPLMSLIPYLDLSLSDFSQALDYPQHALIFLARAIEAIENHFSVAAKTNKSMGKERLMQEMLGVSKRDVEYVTRRANDSHRRHAAPDGKATPLPEDELAECFQLDFGHFSVYRYAQGRIRPEIGACRGFTMTCANYLDHACPCGGECL